MGGTHQPDPRASRALGIGLLLVTVGLAAAAAPSSAYHQGLGTVHSEAVDRPGAFGTQVDLGEPGTLEFVVNGYGQTRSTPVSHGIVLYDDAGDYKGMIVVTAHRSPDRLHVAVSPAGTITSNQADGSGWEVHTDGDVGGLSLTLTASEDEGSEPTIRSFTALYGRTAGPHQAVVWLGEAERTELEVQTDATVDGVATRAGTTHVAGDRDMEQARLDVQAQDRFVGGSVPLEGTQALGAKAMVDARTHVDVEESLRGVWGLAERKGACAQGNCVSPSQASQACNHAVSITCGPASISWSNETSGGQAQDTYTFVDTGEGRYTFSVDRKVDAYEAGFAGAEVKQSFSYLSVADVDLPVR